MIVVIQTIIKTVLLTIETVLLFSGVVSIERIKAKATDPLMVPAAQTIESSLQETFQLIQILNITDSPKIAINRARKQMTISTPMKLMEKISSE